MNSTVTPMMAAFHLAVPVSQDAPHQGPGTNIPTWNAIRAPTNGDFHY